MSKKKSVYIETTIPSYITANDSRDLIRLARHRIKTPLLATPEILLDTEEKP
jgi:hypothetical protein